MKYFVSAILFSLVATQAFGQDRIRLTTESGKLIGNEEILLISAKPSMPRLKARLVETSGAVRWKFVSTYERRDNEDNQAIPRNGFTRLPGDTTWRIDLNTRGFFGGDAAIAAQEGGEQRAIVFKLLGRNPADSVARKYIQSRPGAPWFAWAIAQHESRQGARVYNQFNTTQELTFEPNFGAPDGWGMFQLDSARGTPITTEEVWNWKTNVREGVEELVSIKSEARAYFNAVRRTYPSQWEAPPRFYIPPDTDTKLTYLEAAEIQLYNGASVVVLLRTPSGGSDYYRSCWQFNPAASSGNRWTFVPNRNDYVRKVVADEIEKGLDITSDR